MKFKFLTGDGGKWISPKLNHGDFDHWFVLEFINMDEACGRDNEDQPKYHVCLSAVAPSQVSQSDMDRAFASCGPDDPAYRANLICQVEALSSYGISAPLWQSNGNNIAKLMRDAKREAEIINGITFGFAMDRAVNRIGTTGWEAIKGDITAGLHRTIASGSVEGQILGKMHGASI